jgi:hypothetical protein
MLAEELTRIWTPVKQVVVFRNVFHTVLGKKKATAVQVALITIVNFTPFQEASRALPTAFNHTIRERKMMTKASV